MADVLPWTITILPFCRLCFHDMRFLPVARTDALSFVSRF